MKKLNSVLLLLAILASYATPGLATELESRPIVKRSGMAEAVTNQLLSVGIQNPKNVFSPEDTQATWWAEFPAFTFIKEPRFKARWYSPDGALFKEENFSGFWGNYRWAAVSLPIREGLAKNILGDWRVEILWKDRRIDTKTFTVGLEPAEPEYVPTVTAKSSSIEDATTAPSPHVVFDVYLHVFANSKLQNIQHVEKFREDLSLKLKELNAGKPISIKILLFNHAEYNYELPDINTSLSNTIQKYDRLLDELGSNPTDRIGEISTFLDQEGVDYKDFVRGYLYASNREEVPPPSRFEYLERMSAPVVIAVGGTGFYAIQALKEPPVLLILHNVPLPSDNLNGSLINTIMNIYTETKVPFVGRRIKREGHDDFNIQLKNAEEEMLLIKPGTKTYKFLVDLEARAILEACIKNPQSWKISENSSSLESVPGSKGTDNIMRENNR